MRRLPSASPVWKKRSSASAATTGRSSAAETLCLVDAAYAPFFQRFAFAERYLDTGLLDSFPLVKAWSDALLAEELVTGSVVSHFEDEFAKNLVRRETYIAQFLDAGIQAAE